MNVDVVQRRLWEQSQQHRSHWESDAPLFPVNKYEKRIRGLMDLMHQPQWIAAACDRVLKRSRGKAAGVSTRQLFCQLRTGPRLGKCADPLFGLPQGEVPCVSKSRNTWKAGCLETCTSGLGLGSRWNSSAYTT